MRYRIKFLTESTDEQSVSSSISHDGPLEGVILLANGQVERLQPDGFQIRDLKDARIVWLQHCRI
jgi:hypothetical protein